MTKKPETPILDKIADLKIANVGPIAVALPIGYKGPVIITHPDKGVLEYSYKTRMWTPLKPIQGIPAVKF